MNKHGKMPDAKTMSLYWRVGMTPREYSQAKAARGEMLGHLSQRGLRRKADAKKEEQVTPQDTV